MKVIATRNYSDRYVVLRDGQIYNLNDTLANDLISKNVVSSIKDFDPLGGTPAKDALIINVGLANPNTQMPYYISGFMDFNKYQGGSWWITDAVVNGNMNYEKLNQITQDVLDAYKDGREVWFDNGFFKIRIFQDEREYEERNVGGSAIFASQNDYKYYLLSYRYFLGNYNINFYCFKIGANTIPDLAYIIPKSETDDGEVTFESRNLSSTDQTTLINSVYAQPDTVQKVLLLRVNGQNVAAFGPVEISWNEDYTERTATYVAKYTTTESGSIVSHTYTLTISSTGSTGLTHTSETISSGSSVKQIVITAAFGSYDLVIAGDTTISEVLEDAANGTIYEAFFTKTGTVFPLFYIGEKLVCDSSDGQLTISKDGITFSQAINNIQYLNGIWIYQNQASFHTNVSFEGMVANVRQKNGLILVRTQEMATTDCNVIQVDGEDAIEAVFQSTSFNDGNPQITFQRAVIKSDLSVEMNDPVTRTLTA